MVRTVDDQRFTPFTGMARSGAKFTIAVMHAVIHHTLFFRTDQERRRVIIAYARQHLLTGMNTFPHPVRWGRRPADAVHRHKNAGCGDNAAGCGLTR